MNCLAFNGGIPAWRAVPPALRRLIFGGCVAVFACLAAGQGSPTTIYVATNGNDAWSGNLSAPNANRTDGPKATLDGAKAKIRALKQGNQLPVTGAQVLFMAGVYRVDNPVTLGTLDSGTAAGPIVYKSVSPRGAVLEGGMPVSNWTKLRLTGAARRFNLAAQKRVYQLSLPSAGVTNYGTFKRRGFYVSDTPAPLELFVNDRPMVLAQWPNSGWSTIAARVSTTSMTMSASRPRQWQSASDAWAQGFFGNNFGVTNERITSISRSSGLLSVADAPPYGIAAGCRFKVINVPEELDDPGEYYVDRTTGTLFFWPIEPLSSSREVVSVLEGPIVQTNSAAHIRFEGLAFRNSRYHGVVVYGGSNINIVNCEFSDLGGNGVYAYPASNLTIRSCDFRNLGLSGILLYGGNLATLTSANVEVVNNNIESVGRIVPAGHGGIWVTGVGFHVANNAVHDVGDMAIRVDGPQIVVEQNEIFGACGQVGDAGTIYAGRDMRMHGTIIRNNLIRDSRSSVTGPGTMLVSGIYLDDFVSGISVTGNVFVRCSNGLLLGGGRDNTVRNNLFFSCTDSMHVDGRGMTWAGSAVVPGGVVYNKLREFSVSTAPWSTTFPLVMSYLSDDLRVPKRNAVTVNLYVDSGGLTPDDGYFMSSPNTVTQNASDSASHLVNPGAYDFTLKAGSAGLQIGFLPVSPASMGLFVDGYRLSVPNYRGQ